VYQLAVSPPSPTLCACVWWVGKVCVHVVGGPIARTSPLECVFPVHTLVYSLWKTPRPAAFRLLLLSSDVVAPPSVYFFKLLSVGSIVPKSLRPFQAFRSSLFPDVGAVCRASVFFFRLGSIPGRVFSSSLLDVFTPICVNVTVTSSRRPSFPLPFPSLFSFPLGI